MQDDPNFEQQELSHMGVCHIDVGSMEYFVERHACRIVLDVGCGTGEQGGCAGYAGMWWFGIDLDANREFFPERFSPWDLEDRPFVAAKRFDLVWSIEVAEHIKNEQNFVDTIRHNTGKFAVVTWNPSPGGYHQNPKPFADFIRLFEANGMKPERDIHEELLEHSTMEREFLRDHGMTFSRVVE